MRKGLEQQKLAVQSGHWLLYRYNPALADAGKHPLTIDSKAPSIPLEQYVYNETRYRMLLQSDEARSEQLLAAGQAGHQGALASTTSSWRRAPSQRRWQSVVGDVPTF